MYVKTLRLANFKSFTGDDNLFSFSPAINYLVGNNNAGKSSILEAIDFIRNGCSDVDDIKSVSPNGKYYYVEITLAKNIKEQMQSSNLDEKQIKNLSKYIDLEDGEETLTARRYFTDTDSCKKIQLKKRKDTGEIDYTNSTGIDAPFKSLFNPTLFKATDTPNAILDFSGSRMLGKLIAYETQGFFDSDVWAAFKTAHSKAFSNTDGYASKLRGLETKLTDLTREQFGADSIKIDFDFDTPDSSSFVKMGKTMVDDGIAKTDLSLKGNGMQRAVAFAVIQEYARMLSAHSSAAESNRSIGLFLCVDEPEIWMHPKAQQQLAKALSSIASTEQIWIATHSPYILQYFNENINSDNKLYIFHDRTSDNGNFVQRVQSSDFFGHLHPGRPSLAEVTYGAFQIATPEFHNELFGLFQSKIQKQHIRGDNSVDEALQGEPFCLSATYTRYFPSASRNARQNSSVVHETLPVHIRNLIDHPESKSRIEEDCAFFEEHNDLLPSGCTIESIREQTNEYSYEELEESIRILLNALQTIEVSAVNSSL